MANPVCTYPQCMQPQLVSLFHLLKQVTCVHEKFSFMAQVESQWAPARYLTAWVEGHRFKKQGDCRTPKVTWCLELLYDWFGEMTTWEVQMQGCQMLYATSKSFSARSRQTHLNSEAASLSPRRRSNGEQCAAFTLVQLYIECTILATMSNYAELSKTCTRMKNMYIIIIMI